MSSPVQTVKVKNINDAKGCLQFCLSNEENVEYKFSDKMKELDLTHPTPYVEYENTFLGAAGAKKLSQALSTNPPVTTLYVSNNQIGDEGVTYISKSLNTNSVLTSLDLWCNLMTEKSCVDLAGALKVNSTLTNLNISQNQLGDAGIKIIAEALEVNYTLNTINISNIGMGDEGAKYMSQALKKNSGLSALICFYNNVSSEGALHLGKALEINSTLTTLLLQRNKIQDAGAKHFMESLKKNSTLSTFDISGNDVSDEILEKLALLLQESITKRVNIGKTIEGHIRQSKKTNPNYGFYHALLEHIHTLPQILELHKHYTTSHGPVHPKNSVIDTKCSLGFTPIDYAVIHRNMVGLKWLIEFGVKPAAPFVVAPIYDLIETQEPSLISLLEPFRPLSTVESLLNYITQQQQSNDKFYKNYLLNAVIFKWRDNKWANIKECVYLDNIFQQHMSDLFILSTQQLQSQQQQTALPLQIHKMLEEYASDSIPMFCDNWLRRDDIPNEIIDVVHPTVSVKIAGTYNEFKEEVKTTISQLIAPLFVKFWNKKTYKQELTQSLHKLLCLMLQQNWKSGSLPEADTFVKKNLLSTITNIINSRPGSPITNEDCIIANDLVIEKIVEQWYKIDFVVDKTAQFVMQPGQEFTVPEAIINWVWERSKDVVISKIIESKEDNNNENDDSTNEPSFQMSINMVLEDFRKNGQDLDDILSDFFIEYIKLCIQQHLEESPSSKDDIIYVYFVQNYACPSLLKLWKTDKTYFQDKEVMSFLQQNDLKILIDSSK
eukprot:TRINITY_DN2689_c0_g1_i1.p1 TRINITY_DN2689_c0_g1~~TRINITY_DN2689_c0_g1_i1.p1  ORF type:complete len:776 (+),score=199.30 TRINITY_DN2689_c0_g1_i1:2406-4733(+)